MENEEINVELKSEAMNEMLSHPPSWLVRTGNGIFMLVLLLILVMTWLIKYPDEISGPGSVGFTLAPIERSNQSYLQLKKLFVSDQQKVKKGDLLAEFDNQANASDVDKAEEYLKELNVVNFKNSIPQYSESLQLGTFQSKWSQLQNQINEWNSLHSNDIMRSKITSMQKEVALRGRLNSLSKTKISLSEKDFQALEEELLATEKLAVENIISKQTLAQEKRAKTQSLQNITGQKEAVVQNEIALNSLKKEILQLKYDSKLQEDKLAADIKLSIASLLSSFKDWSKNAIWIASCDGQVLFNKRLQENRFYKPNDASLVVLPKETGFVVIAKVPSDGAGKVIPGQKAFVELLDFPKNEFGMLEGTVLKKASIDIEGFYEIEIRLKEGMKTTYSKTIPLISVLKGNVKIITKKKRLLERFFEKILDVIQ